MAVEKQIRDAIERGDFDDLPGAGKPLRLRYPDDPDWYAKSLLEREQIVDLKSPAAILRQERRELPETLDALHDEGEVRAVLADFNARVRDAILREPRMVLGGLKVEEYVQAWRTRRAGP